MYLKYFWAGFPGKKKGRIVNRSSGKPVSSVSVSLASTGERTSRALSPDNLRFKNADILAELSDSWDVVILSLRKIYCTCWKVLIAVIITNCQNVREEKCGCKSDSQWAEIKRVHFNEVQQLNKILHVLDLKKKVSVFYLHLFCWACLPSQGHVMGNTECLEEHLETLVYPLV